jgi:hypothetical protein
MNRNFVKSIIEKRGNLIPLIIPSNLSKGLGLMNPTVAVINDKLYINIRNINYTLYHSENKQQYNSRYGPLAYLNPENDIHLKTINFLCEMKNDLSIKKVLKVDTSKLDVKNPKWEFHGLEDARLITWNDKTYLTGVRRDTTDNGQGRMELSEILINSTFAKERTRIRIEHPTDKNSYCEKNWMPIEDIPFHYVKWVNPTEIVFADIINSTSSVVSQNNHKVPNLMDLRGGSQVIRYKDYRIAIVHDVDLKKNYQGQKDATYMHYFVIWDINWNLIHISERFSFMDAEIEFACGMCLFKGDLLITFGFQDNAAFMLRIPKDIIDDIIGLNDKIIKEEEKIVETKCVIDEVIYPTLEITTAMPFAGCIVNCVFCPQKLISSMYSSKDKILSLDNFKLVVDKLDEEIGIVFAGFAEPFLNKNCTNMIIYANEKKHKVTLFTTGVGMSINDIDRIKNIPFANGSQRGFTLHLPDQEGYSKHPITDKYIETLEYLQKVSNEISNFRVMCMGTPHDKVKHIFSNVGQNLQMYSRAGNLEKEALLKPELLDLKDKYISTDNGAPCTCSSPDKFANFALEKFKHTVMLPNGDMTICCQDYELKHILGNLFTQEYKDLIPVVGTSFELCRYCENGKKIENNKIIKTV